jgi:hypothetical protein
VMTRNPDTITPDKPFGHALIMMYDLSWKRTCSNASTSPRYSARAADRRRPPRGRRLSPRAGGPSSPRA